MQNPQPGWSETMGAQSDRRNGDWGLALPTRDGLPSSLARALGWLDDHLDEPIQLDTLAAVAGVRPRTLEAHFRRHLATTPLGWVRRMRLARARQQLLAARNEGSMTGVALANGFTELG